MKKIISVLVAALLCVTGMLALTGCDDSPVQRMVVSGERYDSEDALEKAEQPEAVAAGNDIYANVLFIESPKGMVYTAKWLLDGTEIKTEDKEMTMEPKGMIVFALQKELVKAGELTLQILYQGEVLEVKEIAVQ